MRKYLNQTDFSPTIPVRESKPSILDPYKEIIEGYLDEDDICSSSGTGRISPR